MNQNKYEAVYIEWLDSAYRSGWQDTNGFEPLMIKTLGWCVHEDDDYVVVSAHDSQQGEVSCPMSIPRVSITLMQQVVFDK
jgi:hypothetical protein